MLLPKATVHGCAPRPAPPSSSGCGGLSRGPHCLLPTLTRCPQSCIFHVASAPCSDKSSLPPATAVPSLLQQGFLMSNSASLLPLLPWWYQLLQALWSDYKQGGMPVRGARGPGAAPQPQVHPKQSRHPNVKCIPNSGQRQRWRFSQPSLPSTPGPRDTPSVEMGRGFCGTTSNLDPCPCAHLPSVTYLCPYACCSTGQQRPPGTTLGQSLTHSLLPRADLGGCFQQTHFPRRSRNFISVSIH